MGVDARHPAYERMHAHWDLIHDLLGGTVQMRRAGTKWLPQEPKESDSSYSLRLSRSVLYQGYEDTVEKLAAKPFSRPIDVEDGEGFETLTIDADRCGTHLHQFTHSLYVDGLNYGKWHLLVDYPQVQPGITLAEEKRKDVRPYFVRISPWSLFNWEHGVDETGKKFLSKIYFYQTYVEDGKERDEIVEYGIERITVYRLVKVDDKEVWIAHSTTDNTLGIVPLVTRYFEKKADMESCPPLEGLAWMNLAHWQSSSDQRNCLRFARVSMIFMSGISEDEKDAEVVVGPNRVIKSTNPDAKAYHVEHSGAAIAAGEADLRHIEEQMQVLGLQPLVENTGYTTAQGRSMDEAKTHSKAQEWVFETETGLQDGYALAARWTNRDTDAVVKIFSDFAITAQVGQESQSLMLAARDGLITRRTFLSEWRRRGILAEDVDVDAEVDALGKEAKKQTGTVTAGS